MRRQIVTQDETERTKAIVRALMKLGRNKPQNMYYTVNGIYINATRHPSSVTITHSDISRLFEPLVEHGLINTANIEDAYGKTVMICYAVNQSKIKDLERILE